MEKKQQQKTKKKNQVGLLLRCYFRDEKKDWAQFIQSIVSLMRLLMVKMLIFLVSTISNSQVFLMKKC